MTNVTSVKPAETFREHLRLIKNQETIKSPSPEHIILETNHNLTRIKLNKQETKHKRSS